MSKYDDDVADALISDVRAKAKQQHDKAAEWAKETDFDVWKLSDEKFRMWHFHNCVSRILYELCKDMEQTRIHHIEDEDERGHERDMDMMIRMGR